MSCDRIFAPPGRLPLVNHHRGHLSHWSGLRLRLIAAWPLFSVTFEVNRVRLKLLGLRLMLAVRVRSYG